LALEVEDLAVALVEFRLRGLVVASPRDGTGGVDGVHADSQIDSTRSRLLPARIRDEPHRCHSPVRIGRRGFGCSRRVPDVSQNNPARAELVIVANRLPVDRVVEPDGTVGWRRSPGGLVAAIEPVMRANHGAWIGWPGGADAQADLEPFVEDGLWLVPVGLSAREVEEY